MYLCNGMANDWFQFKRFLVRQDKCAMKVGTDGVLLGAWAPLYGGGPVLDIGTGTGLVALIAAQRLEERPENGNCPGKWITALELDSDASVQASMNFKESPWSDHMECLNIDVKEFDSNVKFGTILCNPPFFRDSLRCPEASRNSARHGDDLSFESLSACASHLLAPDGLFSVIIPFDAVQTFIRAAALNLLYPVTRTDICTKQGKCPKRTLLCFSHRLSPCSHNLICMTTTSGEKSDEYSSLVGNLYLKC